VFLIQTLPHNRSARSGFRRVRPQLSMSTSDVSTEAHGGSWLEHGAAAEHVLVDRRTQKSHSDSLMRALLPGACRWPSYQSGDTEKWLANPLGWESRQTLGTKKARMVFPLFDSDAEPARQDLEARRFTHEQGVWAEALALQHDADLFSE